jgi:hypothetical protein
MGSGRPSISSDLKLNNLQRQVDLYRLKRSITERFSNLLDILSKVEGADPYDDALGTTLSLYEVVVGRDKDGVARGLS